MRTGPGLVRLIGVAAVAAVVCGSGARAAARPDPLRGLAARIEAGAHPESSAVIVVSDEDLGRALRALLPRSIAVVPFWPAGVRRAGPVEPALAGRLFRAASAATANATDLWVVGYSRPSDPPATRRTDAFADRAAAPGRRRVARDSLGTPRGLVTISRWLDLPGGLAQRDRIRRGMAYAESVLAHGGSTRTVITQPFTRGDLAFDADSAAWYLAHLADTTLYSIGGCSDVQTLSWDSSEKLGRMGPGIVPLLLKRMGDPDHFVRERVQDALLFVTQDERILARTGGEYVKFYDQPDRAPRDVAAAWWAKFGRFWTPADSTR
ncbi:MAG: hypothetical protein IT347_10395 [Candidatus Eisenbacteria bacterium]|nr:hypothetical protein [Candidatus Eisenbacteria bacterium]